MKPRKRKDSGLLGRSSTPRVYQRASSAWKKYAKYLAIIILAWTIVETYVVRNAMLREGQKEPAALGKEKIFITSIHWTNAAILRSHWATAVTELAKEIGRENVYVSLYESGSLDDTKDALRDLDVRLGQAGISRRIVLDNTTHLDSISQEPGDSGWIQTSRGRKELRRIPYLADLRNRALEPLYELQEKGLKFDKILFLNDAIFTTHDVRTLLATRDGFYAAACSLDFAKPPAFYDTFALRDADGHEALMGSWPFFRSRQSRRLLKLSQPVPVSSCWNGVVAMDAEAFYSVHRSLSFRGISDSLAEAHLEGSECCLIHADNPFSRYKGVWLNPNVRVGYNPDAYEAVQPGASSPWVSTFRVIYGIWMSRILRWVTTVHFKELTVRLRLEGWKAQSQFNFESGGFCLINEMQVIVERGWAHV